MKQKKKPLSKCITLLFINLFTSGLFAQNIPNANFDSIYIGGIDRIYQWITTDAYQFNNDTVVPFTPNTFYPDNMGNHHFLIKTVQVNYLDPDPQYYLKSLVIRNYPELKYPDGSQFNSFICNGNHFCTDASGFIDMSMGGAPFPYRPAWIIGKYKFSDTLSSGSDFGRVEALLKKWDPTTWTVDTIAIAQSGTDLAPTAIWQYFYIPFVYSDPAIPDSIVVMISSSTNSTAPTTLFIDDIYFDFSTPVTDYSNAGHVMKAFPNPFSNTFFIYPPPVSEIPFHVYNIQGKVVASGLATDGKINLPDLSPGIYLININDNGRTSTLKMMKKPD